METLLECGVSKKGSTVPLAGPILSTSTPAVPSHSLTLIDATSTGTPPTETNANMPSQLVTIVIAVVVSAVLILVVVGLVVVMVTVVLCRRWSKDENKFDRESKRIVKYSILDSVSNMYSVFQYFCDVCTC